MKIMVNTINNIKKIDLEGTPVVNRTITEKDIPMIAESYNEEELESFIGNVNGSSLSDTEKNEFTDILLDAINEKKNQKEQTGKAADKIEEQTSQHKEEMKNLTSQEQKIISQKIADLTVLLNGDERVDTEIQAIEDFVKNFNELSGLKQKDVEENTRLLYNLIGLVPSDKQTSEEVYKQTIKTLINIIKNIKNENEQLQKLENRKNELALKYPGNVDELPTKRFSVSLGKKQVVDGITKRSLLQLEHRHNIRTRHRLNTTIKHINEIGDNPEKLVNYLMSRSYLIEGGKISSGVKNIKNARKTRNLNVDKFNELYDAQLSKYITTLETKMDGHMSDQEKQTINKLKKIFEYAKRKYLNAK